MRALLILLLFVVPAAFAETIAGRVIAVTDGDRLTVLDAKNKQHRIRLAGIDAPETRQAFGTQSRQSLAELCLKKTAEVEAQETDRNKRYIGRVTCDGVDTSAEQVRRGMAWVSVRQTGPASPLYELEAHARLRQVGLWQDAQPIPPWEWRRKAK